MRVDAAAPLRVGVAVHVVTVGKLQRRVVAGGLVGFRARAADVAHVEGPGDVEGVVADKLGLEAAGILRGEQAVGRIGLAQLGAVVAALAVGRARHDEADHLAQVPAAVAEFRREPIEQFRMRRQFTLRTEIVHDRAQADAKIHRPEAIRDRTRGDGILAARDPAREIETGETFVRRAFESAGQKTRRRGRDQRTGLVLPVAAVQQAHRDRRRGFGHHRHGFAAARVADFRHGPVVTHHPGRIFPRAREPSVDHGAVRRSSGVRGRQLRHGRRRRGGQRLRGAEPARGHAHRGQFAAGQDELQRFARLQRDGLGQDPDRGHVLGCLHLRQSPAPRHAVQFKPVFIEGRFRRGLAVGPSELAGFAVGPDYAHPQHNRLRRKLPLFGRRLGRDRHVDPNRGEPTFIGAELQAQAFAEREGFVRPQGAVRFKPDGALRQDFVAQAKLEGRVPDRLPTARHPAEVGARLVGPCGKTDGRGGLRHTLPQ